MEDWSGDGNKNKNDLRWFENVADNKKEMLTDAIESLGGYQGEVMRTSNLAERLSLIHKRLGSEELSLEEAQTRLGCLKISKIKELVVNEKTNMRDLNIAVLMTDWDYIAPVYYHRGTALMSLRRWNNAVQDFEMSLRHGYKDGAYRLHHKIGQCQVKLKKYKAATTSFKAALENLKTAKVDTKVETQFTKILKECIKKFSSKNDEKCPGPKVSDICIKNPNKVDRRLSDQLEILEEVGKGRTAFAKSSIPVGSVIALDEGLAAHLNPDDPSKSLQYCLTCLRNVSIPFPCQNCPRVVFCSRRCQELGAESSHKYQCQIHLYGMRQKDTKDGCTIFNTLSVITSKPAQFWLDNQARFLMESPETEWPTPNNTETEIYRNLFDMVTNEKDVEQENASRHSVIVVLLLRALRATSYHPDSKGSGPLTEDEMVLGKLMYKIRLIMDMNAHPVWGVDLNPKDKNNIGTEQIGQGLYTAVASYFNSDCNPNTIRINIGKKMLLVASQNIRKGEEVTDNYCIHFSDMNVRERREWIKENFLFHCCCEACEENWPTYSNISSSRPSEKVSDKLVELEMDNMTALEQGDIEKALECHGKEISLIQANLSSPHQLGVTIRTSFTSCWWRKIVLLLKSED